MTLLGNMYDKPTVHESAFDRATKELVLYLQELPIPLDSSPFSWWKEKSSNYKMLERVAKNSLIIQATSVASERLFSAAGQLLSDRRATLSADSVDNLLFLNKNINILNTKD